MDKQIRQIFSVFCLVMLGLMIWRVVGGVWTPVNWGMFAIALFCCTAVFANFVYIFNYSYALCVALNSAFIWVMLPGVTAALMAGVGIAYGLRLFVFTWQRMHSASYASRVIHIKERSDATPLFVKILPWIQCAFLHTFHLMAVYFVAARGALTFGVALGIVVMLAGTVIESVSDAQKQAGKARDTKGLVTHGLFARWRHPNYAGEILFHVGLIIAGMSAVDGLQQLVVVSVAPLYIIILMISEAERVDRLHVEKYAEQSGYAEYRRRSGSLIPGI